MSQLIRSSDHRVRRVDNSDLQRRLNPKKPRRQERYFRDAVPEYRMLLGDSMHTTSDSFLQRSLNRWTSRWPLCTVRNLQNDQVREYLEDLVERGHTAADIRREKSLFQSFYRWAIRSGWAETNPAQDLKAMMRAPTDRTVSWSSTEQQRLLEACRRRWNTPGQGLILPPEYLYPLTLLGLRTGLHLATLLNLKWRHVDFLRSRIILPASEVHAAGAIRVPLSIDGFQLVKSLRDRADGMNHPPKKVLAVLRPPTRGNRFDSRQAMIDFRYARKRAGIREGDFYSLRLSFARNCAEAMVPIKAAARVVDWEDLDDLVEIYRRFGPPPAEE